MDTNYSIGPSFQYYGYEMKMNGWNCPPDFLQYVDEHWKKFEAPNPMMHHLLGVLYIFIMIGAVVGNGIVIYIFMTTKSLRTSSNILILNLAIADFMMLAKTPVFIYNSFMEGPVSGRLGCQIYGLIGAICGPLQGVSNAAIAFDRYKCITDPIEGRLSTKQVLGIVTFMYMWIFPWVYFPASETWNRFVPEGYLTSCTVDYMSADSRFFITGFWFCVWLCPMIIISVCYYQVFVHVSRHEKNLQKQADKMNVTSLRSGDKQTMRQEIRVAKVGITLTTLFLFSWTPYAVVAFICTFGRKDLVTPFVSMVPALTCKLSASIDPFVYAINHPRYRMELTKRVPWFCIREDEQSETRSSVTEKTQESSN